MQNQKEMLTLVGTLIIVVVAAIFFGAVFVYQYSTNQKLNTQLQVQSSQQNQNQQQQKVNQQMNATFEPEQNNSQNNNRSSNQPASETIGGGCSYHTIAGSCKIASIVKTPESKQQESVTGYEGFDVEFTFAPNSSIVIPQDIKNILTPHESQYPLRLINSWYPGSLYLVKYNIKENNVFDCQALVITKGTCLPIVFKFSKINLSDYFETKS